MHFRRAFSIFELLVAIVIISILMGLLFPAVQSAREAARRAICQNNLRQVSLAVLKYAGAHADRLPALQHGVQIGKHHGAAYGAYSWRTKTLPFMEEQTLYDQLDFDIAPDEPKNAAAIKMVVPVFQCPATLRSARTVMTYGDVPAWDSATKTFADPELPAGANDYVAISDVRTNESSEIFWGTDYGVGAWLSRRITSRSHFSDLDEQARRQKKNLRFTLRRRGAALAKIEDGLSNTLLVAERGGLKDDVCFFCGEVFRAGTWSWRNDIGSFHCMYKDDYFKCSGFFVHQHVAMCDGSVHSLSPEVEDRLVWALLTRAGHEVIAEEW